MKTLISALTLTAVVLSARAADNVATLQGTAFNVDTVAHYYIGPGVAYSHLRFVRNDGGRAFNAFVLDYDRTAAGADRIVPKVEIGCDSAKTAERITSIAARKTTDNAQYIAAINGDFFITSSFTANHEMGNAILGYPNMTCVVDKKLAAPDIIDQTSRENAIVFATDGNMYIDATDMFYRVTNTDTENTIYINATAANYPRRSQDFVIYNSLGGRYTKTDNTGKEITFKLASGQKWGINTKVKMVATTGWRSGGNSRVDDDEIVLSVGPDYTHKNKEWLDAYQEGDTIIMRMICRLPAFDNLKPKIREIMGGDVRILNENVTTTEAIRWINTPSALYSRTLVGYSEDRNHLVMCAVDVNNSSGVSYYEGADLMRYLGCWDALDLDGGGSTAMWTSTHGFMSTLRDGSERAVGNGLFLRLNAPKDNKIASIAFRDHKCILPQYGLYQPVIYGYNQYGQLIDTNVKGFTLSAPEQLGEIANNGSSLLASGSGIHALTATLDGMTTTLAVSVDNSVAAQPRASQVVLDNITPWSVEIQAAVSGEMMAVAPQAYTWESSNPDVASVDNMGIVTGKKDGTAVITGVNPSGVPVAVNITVECPVALEQDIFSAGNDSEWTVAGTGIKNGTATVEADGSVRIDFTISSTRGTSLKLSRDGRLWSRPQGISLKLNSGTCAITKAAVDVLPSNSTKIVSYTVDQSVATGTDFSLAPNFTDFSGAEPEDVLFFPATFKAVTLYLSSKTGAHSITIPSMKAVYAQVNGVENISVDSSSNSTAPVEYFTLQGIRVNSANLVPGIYIRRQGSSTLKIRVR